MGCTVGQAPGSMNFINMQNIGISMIYDLFNHISGKFINIKIVDDSEKIINSISDVGNLNLSGSQLKMIDQKEDVSFINLIGDVFSNINDFFKSVFHQYEASYTSSFGSVVIQIDPSILSLSSNVVGSIGYYSKEHMISDNRDVDIQVYLIAMFKENYIAP